jgi:hypothetical protein
LWYKNNYPALLKNGTISLDTAIKGIQQAYTENVFPEMNVEWGTRIIQDVFVVMAGFMSAQTFKNQSRIMPYHGWPKNVSASSVLNLLKRLEE